MINDPHAAHGGMYRIDDGINRVPDLPPPVASAVEEAAQATTAIPATPVQADETKE